MKILEKILEKILFIIPVVTVLAVLALFVYQAVTLYQFSNQITVDHATLTQVVNFLNQNSQSSSK